MLTCTSPGALQHLNFVTVGQWQTVGHIVDSRPLTQLNDGLTSLHEADDDTVNNGGNSTQQVNWERK